MAHYTETEWADKLAQERKDRESRQRPTPIRKGEWSPIGRDAEGRWWWLSDGPFDTKAEALAAMDAGTDGAR